MKLDKAPEYRPSMPFLFRLERPFTAPSMTPWGALDCRRAFLIASFKAFVAQHQAEAKRRKIMAEQGEEKKEPPEDELGEPPVAELTEEEQAAWFRKDQVADVSPFVPLGRD